MRSIHHTAVNKVVSRLILPKEPKPIAMLSFEAGKTEYTFNLTSEQAIQLKRWLDDNFRGE